LSPLKYCKDRAHSPEYLDKFTRHFLVIYDIREPRRLQRIAKLMEEYGLRVQKSVFEVDAPLYVIGKMMYRAARRMEEEDFLVVFRLCERDWQKRIKFGPSEYIEELTDKPFEIL